MPDLSYTAERQIRDINSIVGRIDWQLRAQRKTGEPARHPIVLHATSLLIRAARGSEHSDRYLDQVSKAATSPAMTGTATWAAELSGVRVAGFLLGGPAPPVYPQLAGLGLSLGFDGAGSITVPIRQNGAAIGGWVSEGAPIPLGSLILSSLQLMPKKLGCISVFAEEMAMASTPSIESVVEQQLRADLGRLLDASLFDTTAASAVRPAGLLDGITPLTASVLAPASEARLADLKALAAAVVAVGGTSIAIVANPVQAISLSAGEPGYPVLATAAVPAGRVIALDPSVFVSAIGEVRLAVSVDATIHADAAPAAVGIAGSPNVVSAPVDSFYQRDWIGIRAILHASWGMGAPAIAYIESVAW